MTHPMTRPLTPPSISGHRAVPLLLRAIAAVLFAIVLLGVPAGPATAQPVASFADLAERLSPAVVNIATAQTIEQPERNGPQVPEGSPFEDLFRDFFENGQPRPPQTVQSLARASSSARKATSSPTTTSSRKRTRSP